MFANMTSALDFHAKALVLRAERQRVIASNIANADTPGYAGRDINFKEAMNAATGCQRTDHDTPAQHQRRNQQPAPHCLQAGTASLGPPPCLHHPNSPQWTATAWTWTASAPTLSTTPSAMKPPYALLTDSPRHS